MGTIIHHSIIVTGWDADIVQQAHAKATELGLPVTPLGPVVTNGYQSFLVCPSGSKVGWPQADKHDDLCAEFTSWCLTNSIVEVVGVTSGEVDKPIATLFDEDMADYEY